MNKARLVAQLLVKRFMAEGSISVVPQRLGSAEEGMQLASAKNRPALWKETEAFAGIAVQAVGYEEGQDKPGVVVYATKGAARSFKGLPDAIDDVSIAVKKIGLVSVHPDKPHRSTGEPNIFLRKERIACGSSCAAAVGDAGTFGAIVQKESDESLHILSNNHVLAGCNHIPPGMPIMAPAPKDARPGAHPPQSIAVLGKVIPMRSGDPRHVPPCEEDVALGTLTQPDDVSSWQGDKDGYDTPTTIVDPASGMRVKKIGRTTGLTTGIIETLVPDPFPVPCQGRDFKGIVWFKNVWFAVGAECPFALPGDSGSLVVTEDGSAAVGLLFSSSAKGDYGMLIPMSHIAKELGVSLVGGHGL